MKLTKQLRRMSERVEASLPPDLYQKMKTELEELSRNPSATGLRVGERAPDFSLPNTSGQLVELAKLLEKGPVVLSFFRGTWCPFCTVELRAQIEALPRIRELGATLVAISLEKVEHSARFAESHRLPIDILTDGKGEVTRAYKVAWDISDELGQLFVKYFNLDLVRLNQSAGWMLPVPATYILDQAGEIKHAYVNANYFERMDPEEIVQVLESLDKN